MVIVKTFMYRSHLDQISSSVDNSSAPWPPKCGINYQELNKIEKFANICKSLHFR